MKKIKQRKEEIDLISKKFTTLWHSFPELRFCQLVSLLHGVGVQDVFFTTDKELLKVINQQLDENKVIQV